MSANERAVEEAIRRVFVEHSKKEFPTYRAMAQAMLDDLFEAGWMMTRRPNN